MKLITKTSKAKKALNDSKNKASKEYIQKKPSQIKRLKVIAAAKAIQYINKNLIHSNKRNNRISNDKSVSFSMVLFVPRNFLVMSLSYWLNKSPTTYCVTLIRIIDDLVMLNTRLTYQCLSIS